MPDTIRQQIVDVIEDKLQSISIAGGFQTNVGASVWEWRSAPFMADELPALIWRDLDEPVERASHGAFRHKRSLHMQVEIVGAGTTSAREYRKMLADVEQAIKSGQMPDNTWWDNGSGESGFALEVRPRISRLVVEQESLKVAGGFYEFFVDYATRDFNAYYA